MRTLNLGILAHVDAGKTTLTERLLFAAGVIDEIGSVDAGSTQTDSLALERQRGITIKSAVVSFRIGDVAVNLIDTPGHPDFIAEVERVLGVLDGAVLVVSAVEGIQAQTRVLMRALQRLRIPTLIFVNKVDRRGARYEPLLHAIATKLTSAVVPMGTVSKIGSRDAECTPHDPAAAAFRSTMIDVLSQHDDVFLAAYVGAEAVATEARLRQELAAQTQRALIHPVYFGSAITGAGVGALTSGIRELLPASEGRASDPTAGTVFKVERGRAGEKVAYVRLFAGTVTTRERLQLGDGRHGKVTAVRVFDRGDARQAERVTAGQIGKLWGLADVRIGDLIGAPDGARQAGRQFSPPTLESVVVPTIAGTKGALHLALSQLAEQDPLINLRHDEVRREISVSLYGEVQKEVIQATLADDFGIAVEFRQTTTICVERLRGTGAAVELKAVAPNPFLATVGLRVEPGRTGTGVDFRLGVELGSMPYTFFTAVEETVHTTLQQGLHGWSVSDCVVTMTHSGYFARQSHMGGGFDKSMSSTAGDFRLLTPLVLMAALQQAGTTVHEPIHRFRIELPADTLSPILPVLVRLGARPGPPALDGATGVLTGDIPAARVHELTQQLPGLTHGEGVLESQFDHYQRVRGRPPTRPRSDHNPLNRKEYLLRVVRRSAGGAAVA